MTKEKIYISVDNLTGEPMSYHYYDNLVFSKRKKDVEKKADAKVREAIITIKIKGIDY